MSWTDLYVGDLVDAGEAEVKTGPFGTQLKASDYVEEGTPVINVRNIGFGDIRPEKLEFIAADTVQRLSSHLLQAGDIVFGRKGAVERHAFIREGRSGWFQGSDCLRLRVVDERRAMPRFLSYVFLGEQHKQWMMQQCSHGATMASLNQDIIRRIPLRLPPLPTQQRVAAILSAYDDLIETNTRRIAILEEMARRLYEEWFVRFRFPGHEAVEFDGDLPRGWRAVTLSDVASVNPEAIKPKSAPERIRYIDIASVSPGRIDAVQELSFAEAPSRARRVVRDGDVIWSCVRPNRRSFALVLGPSDDTVASTGFAVLRAGAVPFSYLFCATSTDAFVDYLTNNATGAAYPAVKQSDFERAELLLPSASVLSAFDQAAQPMLRLCDALHRKSANLRAQRDLLLPKLVSGEIDVSTQEAARLEEVA